MGYTPRMWAIAGLMAAAYWTVALSATRPCQLLGVAFGAAQVPGHMRTVMCMSGRQSHLHITDLSWLLCYVVMLMQSTSYVWGRLQAGLGEATCLAMAALFDPRSLVFWSSGTGACQSILALVPTLHTYQIPFVKMCVQDRLWPQVKPHHPPPGVSHTYALQCKLSYAFLTFRPMRVVKIHRG